MSIHSMDMLIDRIVMMHTLMVIKADQAVCLKFLSLRWKMSITGDVGKSLTFLLLLLGHKM